MKKVLFFWPLYYLRRHALRHINTISLAYLILCLAAALLSCLHVPLKGKCVVFRYPMPLVVTTCESIMSFPVAALCCLLQFLERHTVFSRVTKHLVLTV